jgi:uncharacterized protein YlxW (UPF0749 family)
MEDLKYFNLKEFAFDLTDLLNEVSYLREENATLKKQVKDYDDFVRNLNKRNQNFIGETIKQLIEEVK